MKNQNELDLDQAKMDSKMTLQQLKEDEGKGTIVSISNTAAKYIKAYQMAYRQLHGHRITKAQLINVCLSKCFMFLFKEAKRMTNEFEEKQSS